MGNASTGSQPDKLAEGCLVQTCQKPAEYCQGTWLSAKLSVTSVVDGSLRFQCKSTNIRRAPAINAIPRDCIWNARQKAVAKFGTTRTKCGDGVYVA